MNLTCLMICGFMLTCMGFWYWSWGLLKTKIAQLNFIICCQESCDPRIDGCLPFYLRDNILNIILLIFFKKWPTKRDQGSCTCICLVGKFIAHFYD